MANKILGSVDPAEYERILDAAMDSQDPIMIANRFPWQTRRVHEKLLTVATMAEQGLQIRVLCGSATSKFFDEDFFKQLHRCAEHKCEIKVLIWGDEHTPIADGLRAMAEEELLQLRMVGTQEHGDTIPHGMLIGDAAYRQEVPHASLEHELFTETEPALRARICFHDPDGAAPQIKFFEAIWEISRQVA